VALLLPVFLAAARQLQQTCDEQLSFLIPLASTITTSDLDLADLDGYQDLDIRIIKGERYNLMAACDCAVAASGTVTLELALLDVPMVVAYKLAPLTYRLGTLLIDLPHFSLVNLIAGTEVVPELLQDQVTPEAISHHLHAFLYNTETRAVVLDGLESVRQQLGTEGASDRAAQLAVKILP